MAPTHVTVSAPDGKLTPIHTEDGCEPGGNIMYVEPGWIRRVAWSQNVRRAIRRGDLFLCNTEGAAVDGCHAAAAPFDIGKIEIKKGASS